MLRLISILVSALSFWFSAKVAEGQTEYSQKIRILNQDEIGYNHKFGVAGYYGFACMWDCRRDDDLEINGCRFLDVAMALYPDSINAFLERGEGMLFIVQINPIDNTILSLVVHPKMSQWYVDHIIGIMEGVTNKY